MKRIKFLETSNFPVKVFETQAGRDYAKKAIDHYFQHYIGARLYQLGRAEEIEDRLNTIRDAEAAMEKWIAFYDSKLYKTMYGDSSDDSSPN